MISATTTTYLHIYNTKTKRKTTVSDVKLFQQSTGFAIRAYFYTDQ